MTTNDYTPPTAVELDAMQARWEQATDAQNRIVGVPVLFDCLLGDIPRLINEAREAARLREEQSCDKGELSLRLKQAEENEVSYLAEIAQLTERVAELGKKLAERQDKDHTADAWADLFKHLDAKGAINLSFVSPDKIKDTNAND